MIQRQLAEAGLPHLPRLAWLEIDLSRLATNGRLLKQAAGPAAKLGVVVKADGYGHGLLAAARAAVDGGVDVLLVATADEGLVLRAAGVAGRVLILYAIPPEQLDDAAAARLEVVVQDRGSLDDVLEFARSRDGAAANAGDPLAIHLAVDTGMTRGGFAPADAPSAARALAGAPGLRLAGTWSHLAAPDDPAAVAEQRQRFDKALEGIVGAGIDPGERHLAASGGLLGTADLRYDLVRIGLSFYGQFPPGVPLGGRGRTLVQTLKPALTLLARPVSIQEIPAGAGVGYGFEWRASRPSTVVTLPVGYADGLARLSSPGSWAVVRGMRTPVVGRVSSDAIAVDATNVPGVGPDDEFLLLGDGSRGEMTVDELAGLRRTISWEVLDSLGVRLSRVYRQDGRLAGVRTLDDRVRWAAATEGAS